MPKKWPIPRALLVLALGLPGMANAGKVVLTPLLVEGTVNQKQRVGLHQLLESELDFSPEIDGVVSLPAPPPSLNDGCLANPTCLGSIASANGGTEVITGKVTGQGSSFALDLVYFSGSQIVRRKAFDVSQDPTTLANAMTPIMREMLTGDAPSETAAATPTSDDFDFEDDVGGFGGGAAVAVADDGVADLLAANSFEDLDRQGAEEAARQEAARQEAARIAAAQEAARVAAAQQEAARIAAAQEAARVAAAQEAARIAAAQEAARLESARLAQEAARLEAARVAAAQQAAEQDAARQAEEDRRLAAAAAATGLAAGAAPAAQNDDALAGMITFGGSVEDITVEEIDAMIKFGPPPAAGTAAPPPAYPPPPQPTGSGNPLDPLLAEEAAELAAMENGGGIQDLDGEADKGRKPKNKSPNAGGNTNSTAELERPIADTMQITARGGYSRYYSFDFITAGGEVAIPIVAGLHGIAGLEAYAVNRVLPPDKQIETGLYSEWNTIFPVNVGAMYKFTAGIAQPYVGGDAIFVQYFKDEVGADWAGGARLRGGVDLMVVKNFGFNLNVALGGWSGKNWGLIEAGVATSGVLPQVSGGTVIAF